MDNGWRTELQRKVIHRATIAIRWQVSVTYLSHTLGVHCTPNVVACYPRNMTSHSIISLAGSSCLPAELYTFTISSQYIKHVSTEFASSFTRNQVLHLCHVTPIDTNTTHNHQKRNNDNSNLVLPHPLTQKNSYAPVLAVLEAAVASIPPAM